jgi:hypothetical protein
MSSRISLALPGETRAVSAQICLLAVDQEVDARLMVLDQEVDAPPLALVHEVETSEGQTWRSAQRALMSKPFLETAVA